MLNRKESFLNGKVSGRFARYTAMVLAFATAIAGFELGSIHAPQAAAYEEAGSICPPATVPIDADTNQPDYSVATYVGKDMYIGSPVTGTLNASNFTGSYAVEAEGLTVVKGKLAQNPIKESWSGNGFRWGNVGFGSNFKPKAGSDALVVADAASDITFSNVGGADSSVNSSVASWTRGGWIGVATGYTDKILYGLQYTAQVSGKSTISDSYDSGALRTRWNSNTARWSLVDKLGDWQDDSGVVTWNTSDALKKVRIVDKSDNTQTYDFTTFGTKLSVAINNFKSLKTGDVNVYVGTVSTYVGSGYSNLLYYKYDNKHDYGFTWDDSVINSGEKGYTTEYGYSSYKNLNKRVKFTGDSASKIQVFNVTADQLSNVYNGTLYRGTEFAFVNIPSDARVVVNVTGGDVDFHTGWRFFWGGENATNDIGNEYRKGGNQALYGQVASRLVWNFAEADNVTIRGGRATEGYNSKYTHDDPASAMIGSIIAKGNFDDHVNTNGRVWVNGYLALDSPTRAYSFADESSQPVTYTDSASVIDMDIERHNFPFPLDINKCAAVDWVKRDNAGTSDEPSHYLRGSKWAIYGTLSDAVNKTNKLEEFEDGDAKDSDQIDNGVLKYASLTPSKDYYFIETVAPTGYLVSNKIYHAKAGGEGTSTKIAEYYNSDGSGPTSLPTEGVITNTPADIPIAWSKVNSENRSELLPAATWTIYKASEGSSASHTVTDLQSGATPGTNWWDDRDDTAGKFKLELPWGAETYYITEATSPAGYSTTTERYRVVVDASGTITWQYSADSGVSWTDMTSQNDIRIENPPKDQYLTWSKKDAVSQDFVANSGWTLYDSSGTTAVTNEITDCVSSPCPTTNTYYDEDTDPGKFKVNTHRDIPAGTYVLKETTVPAGYTKATDQTVTIPDWKTLDDGTVTELVFGIGVIDENPVLGSAKWLKVDGMSNPLSGSSWTLTKYTDDTRSTVEHTWTVADDSTGASCTESSSVKCDTDSTSGTIKVESLEWGYYRVEEKDAPSGYIKTDEVWDFEIDARVSGKTNVEKAAAFVDPKERGDLPLTGAWFTPANLIRTGLLVAGAGAATWLIYRKYYASSKQE